MNLSGFVNRHGRIIQQRDERRVWWDEKDCERMSKRELLAFRGLLWAVNFTAYANEDLQDRLACIPYGRQRMRLALGAIRALADDIAGTMTRNQCKALRNQMDDTELRAVPKLTPVSGMTPIADDAMDELARCAKAKCDLCVASGDEARNCSLYKVFEAYWPLEDYGAGYTCPYYQKTIEKK